MHRLVLRRDRSPRAADQEPHTCVDTGRERIRAKAYPPSRLSRRADATQGRGTMKESSRQRAWSPEYRTRVAFRAPLEFVFAWCTDYSPQDASLE